MHPLYSCSSGASGNICPHGCCHCTYHHRYPPPPRAFTALVMPISSCTRSQSLHPGVAWPSLPQVAPQSATLTIQASATWRYNYPALPVANPTPQAATQRNFYLTRYPPTSGISVTSTTPSQQNPGPITGNNEWSHYRRSSVIPQPVQTNGTGWPHHNEQYSRTALTVGTSISTSRPAYAQSMSLRQDPYVSPSNGTLQPFPSAHPNLVQAQSPHGSAPRSYGYGSEISLRGPGVSRKLAKRIRKWSKNIPSWGEAAHLKPSEGYHHDDATERVPWGHQASEKLTRAPTIRRNGRRGESWKV